MTTAEKYVAAAYLVVFLVVLVYVVIMAAKLSRLVREVHEITARVRERRQVEEEDVPRVEAVRKEEVEVG